jgi:cytochrome c553
MSFGDETLVGARARAWLRWAAAIVIAAMAAAASAQTLFEELSWAYASMNPMPSFVESGRKYTLPGSDRQYTRSDTISFYAPADWFPDDHPSMPPIVAIGREAAGIWACGMCHYPNGQGRPENAGLAGLDKAYFTQQMLDFKNGTRRSSDPTKTNTQFMIAYAAAISPDEIEQAAAYFSSLTWRPWIEVVETDTVPKTRVEGGVHLPLEGRDAGREPTGKRIIEMPKNVEYSEIQRNPRVGWIAYVPVGAIARGEGLAHGRGKPTACTICHGESLDGLAAVPALRGRSPSYIARQLGDFKSGARNGAWSPLMASVVASLTAEDILNVSAYLASLPPAGPAD